MDNLILSDVADNIKQKRSLNATTKLQIVLILFIYLKIIFYAHIGAAQSIKYILLVAAIVTTSIAVELVYHVIVNKYTSVSAIQIIKVTNPQIVGLLVASTINYSFNIIPVVLCTIIGLLIARMFFSEHKHQLICSPAFVMVLIHSIFPRMVLNISDLTPFELKLASFYNSPFTENILQITNIKNYFASNLFPFLDANSIFITFACIGFAIILFKKLDLDYAVALKIFMFLFIMSYSFVGFTSSVQSLESNIFYLSPSINYITNISAEFGHLIKSFILFAYLVFGPTAIGIIFYTSYTKALPSTRIGGYIVAFIMALIIFFTKIFTPNPLGFFYALVFCNFLTPVLDDTIICTQINRTITIISLISLSLIVGCISFFISMLGVN